MSETIRTDYYVYAYLRQRDSKRGSAGTPYYIGKGQGYRIHEKNGHPFLPKKERRIKIAENLTEQDALVNARLARILTVDDYDFTENRPILWSPSSSYKVDIGAGSKDEGNKR